MYRGAEYNVDLLPKIRVEVLATDEQADDILDALIAVEKKHVVKVMQLMVTGAKFRGLADSY